MGIVVAIIYLPILGLATLTAWIVWARLKQKSEGLPPVLNAAALATGAAATSLVSWAAATCVPKLEDGFVWQIALTLAVPMVVGFTLIHLGRRERLPSPNGTWSRVLSRLGLGALHAVWIFPVAFLVAAALMLEWNARELANR